MSESYNEDFSVEIIAASQNLHPEKPVTLTSKSLIPYFKEFGLADDNIVPSGLKEYTTEVLSLLNLPSNMDSLKEMLARPEVQTTLKSAIAAANKAAHADKEAKDTINANMPDMSIINGISPDMMKQFVHKAQEEKIQKEVKAFKSDMFVDTFEREKPAPKEEPKETVLEDKPEPLPEPEKHSHEDSPLFCPRCGWVVAVPYKGQEITEEDKIQFAYSIMHRTPYKKTYGLFQNQIKVTFRSKTSRDNDLIIDQIRKDTDNKKFVDMNQMTYYANLYELALLLDSIEGPTSSMEQLYKPKLEDFKDSENPLSDYTTAVCEKYIATEALMRLVSEHFRDFLKTYSALIDEALTENFYSPA